MFLVKKKLSKKIDKGIQFLDKGEGINEQIVIDELSKKLRQSKEN